MRYRIATLGCGLSAIITLLLATDKQYNAGQQPSHQFPEVAVIFCSGRGLFSPATYCVRAVNLVNAPVTQQQSLKLDKADRAADSTAILP